MTLHGTRPLKIGAPTTGLRGTSSMGRPRSRPIADRLDGTYWAPGLAKLPVSNQTSFSR